MTCSVKGEPRLALYKQKFIVHRTYYKVSKYCDKFKKCFVLPKKQLFSTTFIASMIRSVKNYINKTGLGTAVYSPIKIKKLHTYLPQVLCYI